MQCILTAFRGGQNRQAIQRKVRKAGKRKSKQALDNGSQGKAKKSGKDFFESRKRKGQQALEIRAQNKAKIHEKTSLTL